MKHILIILIINVAQIFMIMGQLPQPRVLGGYHALENQFPFYISLERDEKHICGGSILTKAFVITAGVCVHRKDKQLPVPSDYLVVAGTTHTDKGGSRFVPLRFIIHENCCQEDIALIQLKKPFRFDETIQPIAIYGQELHQHDVVTIVGWGATDKTEVLSDKLKFHYFVVNSQEDCEKFNANRYYEGLLCLSRAVHNGVCIGDIGGPAVFQGQLVGISSFVLDSCGSDIPDGFVKVSHYKNWIKKNMY